MESGLPPVQDYPGWYPPKPPMSRRRLGAITGVIGAVVGLLLGFVIGGAGTGAAATPAARPSPAVTVTARATVTASADARAAARRATAAARARSARHLRVVTRKAGMAQRHAVARAVAVAVLRERHRADARVAGAKLAAKSAAGPVARAVSPASGADPRFAYCYEANDAGYGPYYRGRDPEYAWYRDNDGDGEVCE